MTLLVHNDNTVGVVGMFDETNRSYVNDATLEATLCETASGSFGVITNATNASPIVITSTAHGLVNTDVVVIVGVSGNYGANGVQTVANKTDDTFETSGNNGTGAFDSSESGNAKWYRAITGATSISLTYQSGSNGNYFGTIPGTAATGTGRTYLLFIEDVGAYADKFTVVGFVESNFRGA